LKLASKYGIFLFIIIFNSILRFVADGRWTRLQLHNSASVGVHHSVLFVFSGWNWPSNNKILTFLESASNLQSEKVPYIGQLRFFDLHIRIFNLQGLEAPDEPKKKKNNKYAEIDFTSHHTFSRVRRDQFLQNCKKNPP
jgi:hypothetical protein